MTPDSIECHPSKGGVLFLAMAQVLGRLPDTCAIQCRRFSAKGSKRNYSLAQDVPNVVHDQQYRRDAGTEPG
jgi:hypothetical protein